MRNILRQKSPSRDSLVVAVGAAIIVAFQRKLSEVSTINPCLFRARSARYRVSAENRRGSRLPARFLTLHLALHLHLLNRTAKAAVSTLVAHFCNRATARYASPSTAGSLSLQHGCMLWASFTARNETLPEQPAFLRRRRKRRPLRAIDISPGRRDHAD